MVASQPYLSLTFTIILKLLLLIDWLQVTCNTDVSDNLKVLRRTIEKNINLRKYDDGAVSII